MYSHGPEVSTREDLTDAYADMADQKYPGDPKGRTYAELAAEGQFNAAIKGKKIVSYRAATKIYFDIELARSPFGENEPHSLLVGALPR